VGRADEGLFHGWRGAILDATEKRRQGGRAAKPGDGSSPMIAQVFTVPSPPEGDVPAPGPAAQAAIKETREADGCEGLYVLASRDRSGGFAIILWRDEAALKSMQKREEEHLEEIRAENPNLPPVPQPTLYDVTSA